MGYCKLNSASLEVLKNTLSTRLSYIIVCKSLAECVIVFNWIITMKVANRLVRYMLWGPIRPKEKSEHNNSLDYLGVLTDVNFIIEKMNQYNKCPVDIYI